MPVEERFTLESESVGALPVVNWFLARMGVFERLDRFVPHDDARLRLAPAAVIGVALRNIIVGHRPVYALGEWAAPIDAGLLGLSPGEAAALNDDRVGRMLDRLFDADRATLITETVLSVVREFEVELGQLHNDSTTVTLTGGDYPGGGEERGGKAVVKPAFGHNKDFRPDLLTSCSSFSPCRLTARSLSPTGSKTATPPTTRPTSRPGTSWSPSSASRDSSTWRTPSSARRRPWATSPPARGGS